MGFRDKAKAQAYYREHYRRNKKRVSAYRRRWQEKNREKHLAWRRAYRQRNKARLLKLEAGYRERDREKLREYQRTWGRANRDKTHCYKIKTKYGISCEEYQALVRRQKNRCAICGRKPDKHSPRLDVDHDHTTSEVRGLLCTNCNVGLGNFQDKVTLLRRALRYLRKTKIK